MSKPELIREQLIAANCLTPFAYKHGVEYNGEVQYYITPEDVGDALREYSDERVWADLLSVIGNRLFGIEDVSLCAFVAFQGREGLEDERNEEVISNGNGS
jgi:hypothetical protein